jgi:hypothetical protein
VEIHTAVLFGPTDPNQWHPLGNKVQVIYNFPNKKDLWPTPDEVFNHLCHIWHL